MNRVLQNLIWQWVPTALFHRTNNISCIEVCLTAVMVLEKIKMKKASCVAVRQLVNVCFALAGLVLKKWTQSHVFCLGKYPVLTFNLSYFCEANKTLTAWLTLKVQFNTKKQEVIDKKKKNEKSVSKCAYSAVDDVCNWAGGHLTTAVRPLGAKMNLFVIGASGLFSVPAPPSEAAIFPFILHLGLLITVVTCFVALVMVFHGGGRCRARPGSRTGRAFLLCPLKTPHLQFLLLFQLVLALLLR